MAVNAYTLLVFPFTNTRGRRRQMELRLDLDDGMEVAANQLLSDDDYDFEVPVPGEAGYYCCIDGHEIFPARFDKEGDLIKTVRLETEYESGDDMEDANRDVAKALRIIGFKEAPNTIDEDERRH